MGTSFGIALTLVIFAGSELFTGHTMFMTLGVMSRSVETTSLARTWAMSWVGNLIGSALLAVIFKLGGGGAVLKQGADLIYTVSAAKMNAPAIELVARAALCNWLVCLAIWTSARTTSDAAKCILIFWCLFAFIASGFEHSVANMTVFVVALLGHHPASVSLGGMAYNLFWVTIGNIIGGAVFVGLGYWLANTEDVKVVAGRGAAARGSRCGAEQLERFRHHSENGAPAQSEAALHQRMISRIDLRGCGADKDVRALNSSLLSTHRASAGRSARTE